MDHITEAKRYLDNAKEILREKAINDGEHYRDKKYVRLAGHAAYTGVLVALDGIFGHNGKRRKSKEWYVDHLAKRNRKMVEHFEDAYELLHLVMGYDGSRNVKVSKEGLAIADKMISWAEKNTQTVNN